MMIFLMFCDCKCPVALPYIGVGLKSVIVTKLWYFLIVITYFMDNVIDKVFYLESEIISQCSHNTYVFINGDLNREH